MNTHPTISLFVLLALMSCHLFAPAQDLIVTQDDEEIIARVLEINKNHILYHKFNQPTKKPFKIKRSDLHMIIYEDGMKQFFRMEAAAPANTLTAYDGLSMYEKGQADARMYFNKNGAMWGTFGATAYWPIMGIFTGAVTGSIIAAVPPNIREEDVPDVSLFEQSPEYAEGFRKQAQKKKFGKTAAGFGMGIGVQILTVLLILLTF